MNPWDEGVEWQFETPEGSSERMRITFVRKTMKAAVIFNLGLPTQRRFRAENGCTEAPALDL